MQTLLAAASSDRIAIAAAIASGIGVITTSIVAFANLRPGRKKLQADADKTASEVPFAGGAYVRDLSDAASSLVTPLRAENDLLRKQVIELQVKVVDLTLREEDLKHKLHYERDLLASANDGFDHRMKQMALSYQNEISLLKEEIIRLGGSNGGANGPTVG